MILVQHRQISRAGVVAIARRYGGPDRVDDFLARYDRGEAEGERFPTGTAEIWSGLSLRNPTAPEVMAALGTVPRIDATPRCFARPDARGGLTEPVGLPVPSDLDGTGRCRCGCGFRDGPPRMFVPVETPAGVPEVADLLVVLDP